MVDGATVHNGVLSLLDAYARVQSNDWCLLSYTPDSRLYAAHVIAELEARGIRHSSFPMAPLVDDGLMDRMRPQLPPPSDFTGNFVVITLERDSMSHFDKFAPLFRTYGEARTRILRIISASDEFFSNGLTLKPVELEQLNATLLDFLADSSHITLTSSSGTHLEVEMDQDRYEWISNRGRLRPGAFTILPPGEVASYPDSISGVLVADGAVNCNVFCDLDMRLADHPLRIEIEDSQIVHFDTRSEEMKSFLNKCFSLPNARRVGELGFGTNRALSGFIAHNSHLNERHPGIHIGFGQHNQPLREVAYEANVHIDCVTNGGMIRRADTGRVIDISLFKPSSTAVHPKLIRDEDITGDCCSSGCMVISV